MSERLQALRHIVGDSQVLTGDNAAPYPGRHRTGRTPTKQALDPLGLVNPGKVLAETAVPAAPGIARSPTTETTP